VEPQLLEISPEMMRKRSQMERARMMARLGERDSLL